MKTEIQLEPVRTEWHYEYSYGLCSQTTSAVIIGLSIIISIKIAITFVLALKRKKNKNLLKEIEKLRFISEDQHLEGKWHDRGYNNAIDAVIRIFNKKSDS